MKNRKPSWTPFRLASTPDATGAKVYVNSRYQVAVSHVGFEEPFGEVLEMSLKRRDKEPLYDWRDIQKIKNELFGPEVTALQVFPPESRLMDTSNQYYFYVLTHYHLPFGFKDRALNNNAINVSVFGTSKQRPFDPEHCPANLEEEQARFDAARVIAMEILKGE